ncbi:MAG: hypothetical protein N6V49_00490 [Serratia symbiotica]|nr:hypothetical protein [Serratia symbiotica]
MWKCEGEHREKFSPTARVNNARRAEQVFIGHRVTSREPINRLESLLASHARQRIFTSV